MSPSRYRLVIGNKAWSSWSLRPWLAMTRFNLPFDEINVGLRQADSKAQILKHSPSGKVPALIDGEIVVWDSLAILDYLAHTNPGLPMWPVDKPAYALARSIAAEMHAGFQDLRSACAMDLFATTPLATVPDAVAEDIRRIVLIWRMARGRFGETGPFLFGAFSTADAMFAPVASRFRTYVPDLAPYGDDGTAAAYVGTIFAMPEMDRWANGARAELSAAALAN